MAKKKDAEAPAEAPTEAAAPPEKITQRVAVERALAAGKDSPAEGVAFVQEQFGITLSNQGFSSIKSQLKKAAGTNTSPGKRGRPAGATAAPIAAAAPSSNGSPADLARQVKALVGQYGAETIKDMVEVFAK